MRRLDQALGMSAEPISPDPPAPGWRLRATFGEPVARVDAIASAADGLIAALCRRLADAGQGARRLELDLHRVDGRVDTVTVGVGRPSRDPAHLSRLVAERLERPAPRECEAQVDLVVLTAGRIDPLAAVKAGFADDRANADATVSALTDRIVNRLGRDAVTRLAPCANHLPERRQIARPAQAAPSPVAARSAEASPVALAGSPERPLRLLPRPEPVTVIAPVPDEPPALFRWRGRTYRVVRADGPERLAPEWWRPMRDLNAATRDYYRVEERDGSRYWLFRSGLHAPRDSGNAAPAWYLHGFFG